MSVNRGILRTVGFLIDCGLLLLCSNILAVMAATWTNVTSNSAGKSVAFNGWQTGFADWETCRQACAAAAACRMFVFDDYTFQCKLSQDGGLGLVHGVTNQINGKLVGQIDATGALIWLGAGDENIAIKDLSFSPKSISLDVCSEMCDSPEWVPPCLAVEVSRFSNTKCFFRSGYFDVTQMNPSTTYDSSIKQPDVPDPTGYGTRIAAAKLPPPPAPLNGAIPSYEIVPKGYLSQTTRLQADVVVDNRTECATLCHTTDNCHSFMFKFDYPGKKCDLFDFALKGVMRSGDMAQYGLIDRDGQPGNIESIVSTSLLLYQTKYKKVAKSNVTMCATHCYEAHVPFYCTMFEFWVGSKNCYLFAIEYLHNLNSTAFSDSASVVYGRITDGRRAYHHPTDNGEPIRGMENVAQPTTTTTPSPPAPKPAAVVYRYHAATGGGAPAARETVALPAWAANRSDRTKRSVCSLECFTRRDWCSSSNIDSAANLCLMYDAPTGSDQMLDIKYEL